jgi:hypothetical protein
MPDSSQGSLVMKSVSAIGLAIAFALSPAPAFAWGATGHELVTGAAIDMLSKDLPAFLKTKTARWQITLLGREPDRWRGAGLVHDRERDQAHYLDIGDDEKVNGLYTLDLLPATRGDFEKGLRLKGVEPNDQGYLPYAIIDGYQQVAKDFAYWRASKVGAKKGKTRADRYFFAAEMKMREQLIIRDIGVWSHYVGDGSQPLHLSDHYNGWPEQYPDPMTYPPPGQPPEVRGLHAYFEGGFVKANITAAQVKAAMAPYRNCSCAIDKRVPEYLKTTLGLVRTFYQLVTAGALRDGTPEMKTFTTQRLAAGASEVRDLVEEAWKASATMTVGYPVISVADIESGKVILTRDSYGAD